MGAAGPIRLQGMALGRDALHMKLGAAQGKVPGARSLVDIEVPEHGAGFTYTLNRQKLRRVRRREGPHPLDERAELVVRRAARLGQRRRGTPRRRAG